MQNEPINLPPPLPFKAEKDGHSHMAKPPSKAKAAPPCSHEFEHVVQFYSDDASLANLVGTFLGTGLSAGERVVIVATPAHWELIAQHLQTHGHDVPAASARGQILFRDAAQMLTLFMRNGWPDENLFRKAFGDFVQDVPGKFSGLRAFGEMVSLLCAEEKFDAAIELERLWNNVAKVHEFALFCAYQNDLFEGKPGSLKRIRAEHSQTVQNPEDLSGNSRAHQHAIIKGLVQENRLLNSEIAERKEADYAVYRLAAIVESADDAIISKDLNGIITSWNKGAERIFGYTPDEIIGKSVLTLIPPDHQNEEPAILERLRRGERIDHYETVRRRKDGRTLEVSLTVSPIRDSTGKIIGASKIARDVTERKQIERALADAREQLARANEELERRVDQRTASLREVIAQMEEFSYSVSHDLRAPVRAMCGYAKVLKEDYGDRIDEEGRNYIDRIIRGGVRMDRLIQDTLTYSRMSRREMRLHRVVLDQLVHEIVEQYPEIHSAKAKIKIQSPLPDVIAHEPSLSQAIANLLNNAVKFVEPGVEPQIRICGEKRNGFVRLRIEDNGIGIKPEHQKRLFGMFERIHPEKHYEGTGIGLAIVRRALERMNGTVGVESDGLTGSNFWLQLPAAPDS